MAGFGGGGGAKKGGAKAAKKTGAKDRSARAPARTLSTALTSVAVGRVHQDDERRGARNSRCTRASRRGEVVRLRLGERPGTADAQAATFMHKRLVLELNGGARCSRPRRAGAGLFARRQARRGVDEGRQEGAGGVLATPRQVGTPVGAAASERSSSASQEAGAQAADRGVAMGIPRLVARNIFQPYTCHARDGRRRSPARSRRRPLPPRRGSRVPSICTFSGVERGVGVRPTPTGGTPGSNSRAGGVLLLVVVLLGRPPPR